MWRYHLLILILTPFIIVYTVYRAIKFKDIRYLTQRLGINKFISITENNKPVWIHAASVGEVIAVIPLVQKILEQYPKTTILITTNTNTGSEIVKTQLSSYSSVQHFYMPIDWRWAVTKFISNIKPQCILVFETELWPNLFSVSEKKNIPVIIFNARLSHRTTSANSWVLKTYTQTLKNVTKILARSEEDHQNYLKLGASKSKVKLLGNIKFAVNTNLNIKPIDLHRPYILAASTHDDEELQLASIWMNLIKENIIQNEILVIVPRHPDRMSAIIHKLQYLNCKISIRSKNEKITGSTQIYIADTIGELKQFMLQAKFIFMGGSLISHGGQNIIEPAQLAKAIVFGPHMYNFKDETKLLIENNAAIQVMDKTELYEQFKVLLQNQNIINQLSNSVKTVMRNKENTILQQYMLEIDQYIMP
jgi:3-deoxy-D-manno-octulosonic-acid transferase